MEEFTPEAKKVLFAYLSVFNTPDGKIVLDDLRKSYHDKPFDENRMNDVGYLAARATEHNVYLKIVRIRERAAEIIQTAEGVTPARTPEVIIDEPEA